MVYVRGRMHDGLRLVLSYITHLATWCNRGTERLMANEGRVKGGALRERPLLKSILCQDEIYVLL